LHAYCIMSYFYHDHNNISNFIIKHKKKTKLRFSKNKVNRFLIFSVHLEPAQ